MNSLILSILKYQTTKKFVEASHFKTKFSETAQENYSEEVRANGPKNCKKSLKNEKKIALIARFLAKPRQNDLASRLNN